MNNIILINTIHIVLKIYVVNGQFYMSDVYDTTINALYNFIEKAYIKYNLLFKMPFLKKKFKCLSLYYHFFLKMEKHKS